MTLEQRKIELINWITDLDNEAILKSMENLKSKTVNDVSEEILQLLKASESTPESLLVKHTSSKDLLG